MILSLLAFSPYAHGEFEKKLLAFLLKSCTKPYLNFIKNIMRGVIVDNQVEDFCGTPVSVNKDVNAATGKKIFAILTASSKGQLISKADLKVFI